jgi:G3E family GTPase
MMEATMRVEVIAGFLGSGKTTTILNLIGDRAAGEGRTVLLVNEFGQVGVDGAVLESQGDAVRELVSGCICCTLRADFVSQLDEIHRVFNPERVVIEPSGVASLKDVLKALQSEKLKEIVDDVRTVLVLDADDYDWFTALAEEFVDAQIGLAQLILINKTDLASPELVEQVTLGLEDRNPHAVVLPTSFGAFRWAEVEHLLPETPRADGPDTRLTGFESFSSELTETFSLNALRCVFQDFADGRYGEIRRAKGIFHTGPGCHRLDLAGGRIHEGEWPCSGVGRINVVGRELDSAGIQRAVGSAVGTMVEFTE